MRFSDADVVLLRRQHEVAVEMEKCNLSKLRTLSDAFNEADGCENASFCAMIQYNVQNTQTNSQDRLGTNTTVKLQQKGAFPQGWGWDYHPRGVGIACGVNLWGRRIIRMAASGRGWAVCCFLPHSPVLSTRSKSGRTAARYD